MLDTMYDKSEITLLGVWAHPDDEAYLSATLMHRVSTAGGRVVVATATLGEAGVDSLPPEQVAPLRHQELRAALASVAVSDLRILGYRDGDCQDVDHEEGIARVEELIRDVRPDVIVTFGPDGITRHPDHSAVSRWTMAAWQRVGHGELLLATMTDSFLIEHGSLHERLGLSMLQSVPESELALRVTPSLGERSRKRDALDAHISQTAPLTELLGYSAFHDWWIDECFRVPTHADLQWATPAETAGRTT
jgi:LmbE family N-acetylglucosaminyl deacetylase